MLYYSKPHTVQAFRFNPKNKDFPDWFMELLQIGRAQVTINTKDAYICLYSSLGNIEKAYAGDWICLNTAKKVFKITEAEFKESFRV